MSFATGKEFKDPLYQQLPTDKNPTEILAARFSAWHSFIKGLINYMKEVILIHEESILQQVRLQNALTNNFPINNNSSLRSKVGTINGGIMSQSNFSSSRIASNGVSVGSTMPGNAMTQNHNSADEVSNIRNFFLPFGSGSVVDVPNSLHQYHKTLNSYIQRTLKELSSDVIPKLEELNKDLTIKIKEIRNLSSDFNNNITKEIEKTKAELSNFYKSIDSIKSMSNSNIPPQSDPYLTKLYLDRQIKMQLMEEKFLFDAFLNIQTPGRELEKLIVIEIQKLIRMYARLIGEECQVMFDLLVPQLDGGILSRSPEFEWESFLNANQEDFINTDGMKVRKFSDIKYKYQGDPLCLEVRSSFLERRSKFLKSYTRGWYVLTPTFIHEFKSSDRKKDISPIMSLNLDDCQVAEHSKKDSANPNTWHKFVLHTKQNGIIHRGHNWVFRAESYELMIGWYNDIKKLTQLPTAEARAHFIAEKIQLEKEKVRNSLRITASSNISSGISIESDK